jgi:DNA adenine methylase
MATKKGTKMKSPLPYIGGKTRPAQNLIDLFPPHDCFVELFCGGASISFRKEPSKVEVINDLNDDVTNFFRVLQFHHEELIRHSKFTVASRNWFELLKKTDPSTLTDIQRAFRFWFIQKNSFGGRVKSPNFHYCRVNKSNFNPLTIAKQFKEVHERLARVQVECLPYQSVIEKYDTPKTFFFCDPPYYKKPIYKFNFSHEDYVQLEKQLSSIKGKFLLTLNDVPEIRKIFSRFKVSTISFAYTCLKQKGQRFTELVIRNY